MMAPAMAPLRVPRWVKFWAWTSGAIMKMAATARIPYLILFIVFTFERSFEEGNNIKSTHPSCQTFRNTESTCNCVFLSKSRNRDGIKLMSRRRRDDGTAAVVAVSVWGQTDLGGNFPTRPFCRLGRGMNERKVDGVSQKTRRSFAMPTCNLLRRDR